MQNYWKSTYISELSDSAIETILKDGNSITSPMSVIHIHRLGGEMRRVGDGATAFTHRDAPFALNIVSCWPNPAKNEKHVNWTRNFFDAPRKFSAGVYVNFLGDEGADRVKEAYAKDTYKKLVELKNKYDPSNFFHLNQNIKPSLMEMKP